jgi:hypothetical protein
MGRTRFLLVAVGAVIVFLVGAVNLVLGQAVLRPRHAREFEWFVERYERDGADQPYRVLFGEAKGFREQLARTAVDHAGFVGGAGMSMGFLLFCWLIDRHRLMKRIASLDGRPAPDADG